MILTDTSILVDYFKKRPEATAFVEKKKKANLAINTVIAMELYQGALNKKEFLTIQKELKGFFMLPIMSRYVNWLYCYLKNMRSLIKLAFRIFLSHLPL